MTIPEILKITSTISSALGSLILAYRVTGILAALSVVAASHEANINQLMDRSNSKPILHWANSTAHVQKAQKKCLLYFGFFLIILSGLCQTIALLFS